MLDDIERVLISEQQIDARVRELADQITADHAASAEVTIIPILTGAMIFCADLIRRIPIAMRIGLMTVSSYPGQAVQTQGSKLVGGSFGELAGRHVLIVDDILDSGGTLKLVIPMVQAQQPASVKTCVLLRKDRPSAREVQADYVGFDIPDQFVVGYGLDYDDYYRNLPRIVTLRPQVLSRRA